MERYTMANMSVSFSYYANKLEELQRDKQVKFDCFHHGDNFNDVAKNFYNSAVALKVKTVNIQECGLYTIVSIS
jgi:hypothetical protein